ncbi:MAG TPA: hypothetical protein VFU94_06515 [Conexibacter sp.]|nr:hypothetical protein [Conexibacter sp.]
MTMLQNGQTVVVDLGQQAVLSVRNMAAVPVYVYVDWQTPDGRWSAISGQVRLAPGALYARTRTELGHEHVRVGTQVVQGEAPGYLVEVSP